MEQHTAKNFVLQLGSLISLYLSLAFFLVLIFGFVNVLFPDTAQSVWEVEQAASNIRIGFAMVLVFFPTYLVLTRLVNKNRRGSQDNSYLGLTKWLIYLSLLVSGLVLLGDLVAVVMGLLEGELTTRFVLKAAAVFIVAGAAFYYYIQDAKGYWLENEKKSVVYAVVTSVVVVLTLAAALTQIPNPAQVRAEKIDNQMVSDLRDIQWRVDDYYRANNALPEDLQTLYGEFSAPSAPAEKAEYRYEITGNTTYQLCAEFAYDSSPGADNSYSPEPIMMEPGIPGNYNWDYKAGDWCFKRAIETRNLETSSL